MKRTIIRLPVLAVLTAVMGMLLGCSLGCTPATATDVPVVTGSN